MSADIQAAAIKTALMRADEVLSAAGILGARKLVIRKEFSVALASLDLLVAALATATKKAAQIEQFSATAAEELMRAKIITCVPEGFRDDDGVWHEGPHRRDAIAALSALVARAEQAETEGKLWCAEVARLPIKQAAEAFGRVHAALAAAGEAALPEPEEQR